MPRREQFEAYLLNNGMDAMETANVLLTLEKKLHPMLNVDTGKLFQSVYDVGFQDVLRFVMRYGMILTKDRRNAITLYSTFLSERNKERNGKQKIKI